MNGTFQDAAGWFWAEENDLQGGYLPLPIRLLHEHYDVWLTNFRGSTYSKGHMDLDSNSEEYWNFSQLEKGYDQVATINFIKKAS